MRTDRVGEGWVGVGGGVGRAGLSQAWTARLTALHALIQLLSGLPHDRLGVLDEALAVAERSGDRLAVGYSLHVLALRSLIPRRVVGLMAPAGRRFAVIRRAPRANR